MIRLSLLPQTLVSSNLAPAATAHSYSFAIGKMFRSVLPVSAFFEFLQGKFNRMSSICEPFLFNQFVNPLDCLRIERDAGFHFGFPLSGHQYPTIPQYTTTVIYVCLPHYTLLGYDVVCSLLREKNGVLEYSNSDR